MQKKGYASITTPDGRVREADTFTCGHCQRIVHVKAGASPYEMGGACSICGTLVCPKCVGQGCDPFEEKLKRMEARMDAQRSYEECG